MLKTSDVAILVPTWSGDKNLQLAIDTWIDVFAGCGNILFAEFDNGRGLVHSNASAPVIRQHTGATQWGKQVRIPTAVWPGRETGKYWSLCQKVVKMFPYALDHFPTAQWFVKTDTDTFVFPQQLMKLLSEYDSMKPQYIGYVLTHEITPYTSGSLYILSRPALVKVRHRLERAVIKEQPAIVCYEDLWMGKYLKEEGISPQHTDSVYYSPLKARMKNVPHLRNVPFVALHDFDLVSVSDDTRVDIRLTIDALLEPFEC